MNSNYEHIFFSMRVCVCGCVERKQNETIQFPPLKIISQPFLIRGDNCWGVCLVTRLEENNPSAI